MARLTIHAVPVVLAATLALPAACSAAPSAPQQSGKHAMIAPPPGTASDLGQGEGDPAAAALAQTVTAELGDRYRIASARYFKLQEVMAWNAVSKFVAGQRTTGGNPPTPRWRDEQLHLVDIYPAERGKPPFAVAMAKAPLADGTKLVGYFDLIED